MGKKSTRRLIVNFTPKFVVSIINIRVILFYTPNKSSGFRNERLSLSGSKGSIFEKHQKVSIFLQCRRKSLYIYAVNTYKEIEFS